MIKQPYKPSVASERREAAREEVLWVASLCSAGRRANCVIVDISPRGAKVELMEPLDCQARITLVIPPFMLRADRVYRCEPVWRAQTTLGLRFVRLSDL